MDLNFGIAVDIMKAISNNRICYDNRTMRVTCREVER